MIVHRIKATGFRIIGEPMDIHFPDSGKIGILGQNETGKTTFLQVIEYALYGLKKGAGVEGDRENLVTWGKNEAKLEIEFTSGQNRYDLQRVFNIKSLHKATLTPVINGIPDRSSSITGLKDIEEKIEQITGMDRDSFTKLVYIRQKDLDALRELAKTKREQLVNKVMGIDLFDDASARVKDDFSAIEKDLEKKKLRLEKVCENKEMYQSKQKQKIEVETATSKLEPELREKKAVLDETKNILAKYDWLNNHNAASESISLLRKQKEQVEKDVDSIHDLEKKIETHKATLSSHKAEYLELQSLQQELSKAEQHLSEAEESARSIETNRSANIERLGLSGKDVELLSKDLGRQKHQKLLLFASMLVCGLAVLFSAFFTTFLLIIIGVVLLGGAAYEFMGYMKVDKLITKNAETDALTKQLKDQEAKISDLRKESDALTAASPFKTHEDVGERLSTISKEMKNETGEGSIEGIEAVLRSSEKSLEPLVASDPLHKKRTLEGQIQRKDAEIEELIKNKPQSADDITYSKKQHELTKKGCEELQEQYSKLDKDIGGKQVLIQKLSEDLEKLKSDHDLWPLLEKEVKEYEANVGLLKRVFSELCATSKELRNKVIPQARFIINQILPTLTNDRYSDFEITEDLKFKVYSKEGGGYKEREIFSGGTQDQFLIALRLAFTQSILDSRVMADKYSLLMDECTSSSDETRKQGIFEVLDATKNTFSQIFIIAHEDISAYVDQNLVLARNERGFAEVKSRSW
jgi:exonuclease SbcC